MRILLATGGSTHSETALRLAGYLLQTRHSATMFTVLTVIKHQDELHLAESVLAQACEILKTQVPELQTKIRIGRRDKEIIREAKEGSYDLALLGKRPAHRLVTRFLGSTATHVMEHAPCPVIIAQGKPRPVRRILLCDSGAQSPSLLHRFTAQLAELLFDEVEITVLHVMSQISAGPEVRSKQLQASASELIEEHAPEGELLMQDIEALQQANLKAYPKVRHGLVVDEILDEAKSGAFDLVVIGSYDQKQRWNFLLDNLARQIIAQIERPVLVLR